MSFAVDENVVGILAGVDGQTSWVSFSRVFVEPIAEDHDMGSQVKVVQVAVGVFGWWLSDDDAAEEAVQFLETGVSMPEVSTSIASPLVSERRGFVNMTGKNMYKKGTFASFFLPFVIVGSVKGKILNG